MNVVAVDFLPVEYRERRSRKRASFTYSTVLLLVLLVMAFAWHRVESNASQLHKDLERVRARYAEAKVRIGQVEQLDAKKSELARRLDVLRDVLARTRGALVLDSVADSAPEATLLTKLEFHTTDLTGPPQIDITIEGRCEEHLDVANLLSSLESQPHVSDVRMVLSEDVDSASAVKKFVVTAKAPGLLAAPAAAEAGTAGEEER